MMNFSTSVHLHPGWKGQVRELNPFQQGPGNFLATPGWMMVVSGYPFSVWEGPELSFLLYPWGLLCI
jgi:hypothetical protein